MSFNLPGEVNPFEAPRAGIGDEARFLDSTDDGAELVRREHVGREASLKAVGYFNYLGAFFAALGTVLAICMAAGVYPTPPNEAPGLDPAALKIGMGLAAVFYLGLASLGVALGFGLTHLQAWARWTALVFTSIGLLGDAVYALIFAMMFTPLAGLAVLLIGGGSLGLVLYLLASSKAGVVFSDEYKDVIRKTPHVGLVARVLLRVLLVMVLYVTLIILLPLMVGGRDG